MRSGPTNPELKKLIEELSKGEGIWQSIATDLNKPSRMRREVNLSRINRNSHENDVVLVPGKVLASGELDHKIIIAAWRFSGEALTKIRKANSQAITIEEAMKKHGKNVKIMG